jgi:hypothetical protein
VWPVTPSAADGHPRQKGRAPAAQTADTGERGNHRHLPAIRTPRTDSCSRHTSARHAAHPRPQAGDPTSRHSAKVRDSSAWLLTSSAGVEVGTELSEHLHRLLARLEPVTALIWELVQEGYEASWVCYVASHAAEHAAQLDRTTLQRLLALPGDLWLDVCGDGTDNA